MFLGIRDIRAARGRFALMTGVVALVALLLVVLSSLTRGLGLQNTSTLDSVGATTVALASSGGEPSWGESVLTARQVHRWEATPGVGAEPIGLSRARLEAGDGSASVVVLGVDPSRPAGSTVPAGALGTGGVVVGRDEAELLGVGPGDRIDVNGTSLTVSAVEPGRYHSHSPVVVMSLATQADVAPIAQRGAGPSAAADDAPAASAVILHGVARDAASSPEVLEAAEATRTQVLTGGAVDAALPGYGSERGSLLMIQGFLVGITGLVVLAFLSVWTVQRTRDIAVLRALGAARRYVLTDALGQAAVLLLAGSAVGGAVGTLVALAVRTAVPVEVAPSTTLLPTLGVLATGLVGSLLATRRVTTVDPQIALGGQ